MQTSEQTKAKMQKVLENFSRELASIQSGRARPSLIDNIKVNIYNQMMTLSSVASINATDAKTLVVTVWDQNNVDPIDKGLRLSPLGLNPRIEGNKLFINIPPVSEERRLQLIKLVKQKEEEAKVAIRNIRRDSNQEIKETTKSENLSEDEEEVFLKENQDLTDEMIKVISQSSQDKQKQLSTL